jgi:hypothetical protein
MGRYRGREAHRVDRFERNLVIVASVVVLLGAVLALAAIVTQPLPATPTSAAPAATPTATRAPEPQPSLNATSEEAAELQAPSAPAPKGSALKRIDSPPDGTIAMLDPSAATPGSVYAVTFAPFGIGPEPQSFLIRVVGSTPQGSPARPFAFANQNVVVDVDPTTAALIAAGGDYRGKLTLVEVDGLLVPKLSEVQAGR